MSKKEYKFPNPKLPVPKTKNQSAFLKTLTENDIIFVDGLAGCGKTFLSIGAAVQALFNGEIDKIIVTRPIVELDEEIGTLPGDIIEKTAPYILSVFDQLKYFIGDTGPDMMVNRKLIEICPLAYIRGRTFIRCMVIGDELQNATMSQLKTLLTRIGHGSKLILNGDTTQTDRKDTRYNNAFKECMEKLKGIDRIAMCYFDRNDICRHDIISKILERI